MKPICFLSFKSFFSLIGIVLLTFSSWAGVLLLASCSLERKLPIACVSEKKKNISELCVKYQKKDLDEAEIIEMLVSYGFNEKDAQSIFSQISKQTASCRIAVNQQCDLIMLRNGVGY
jgi:hypothetical protein